MLVLFVHYIDCIWYKGSNIHLFVHQVSYNVIQKALTQMYNKGNKHLFLCTAALYRASNDLCCPQIYFYLPD